MHVRIVKPREHETATRVDRSRGGADVRVHARLVADEDQAVAGDREGGGPRALRADGVDARAADDKPPGALR